MKAKIIIEQFQNGISIKWRNDAGDAEHIVALTDDSDKILGKLMLDDLDYLMESESCNKVEMTIEYKPIKEE